MITAAAILLPVDTNCHPLTELAGLSLLKRAILTAQRSGAKTCYIVTAQQGQELTTLQQALDNDSRLTSALVWVTPAGPDTRLLETADGQCLAFEVQTLFAADLARRLAETAAPAEIRAISSPGEDSSPGRDSVLVVFPARQLSPVLTILKQTVGRLSAESLERVGEGAVVTSAPVSDSFVYQVSSARDVPKAEKALLLSLPNPKDGIVDAYLNRKLSRPLTRLILRTPLTPNQVTVMSCVIGLIGAVCFWGGGSLWPIAGGLLLQFSAVVDCMDGEIARVKFLESPLGAWLDITLDTVVHIAIFLGVGMAVWNQGGTMYAPLLGGALAAGAFISFPLVTMAEKTEAQGKEQGGWENRLIQKMVEGLASRDYSIIVLLCAVVQQLSWFLWSAAVGVQVFWLSLAMLLYKAKRLNWQVFWPRSLDV